MSCRSSPGFGSRNAMTYPFSTMGEGDNGRREGPGSPGAKAGGTMMVVNSRIKKALGLKSRRSSMMRLMNQTGATSNSGMASPGRGVASPGRVKRPMTSSEIMRQQMRVTELSDNRLRKTLMRTLVGQVLPTLIYLISFMSNANCRFQCNQINNKFFERPGSQLPPKSVNKFLWKLQASTINNKFLKKWR